MSYKYGKHDNKRQVSTYAFKSAGYLLLATLLAGIILSYALQYLIPLLFPKYVEGVTAAQITVFTGVVYGVNLVFHNALNALKIFNVFKFIILLKLLSIVLFTYLSYLVFPSLLVTVAVGALLSEVLSSAGYIFFLKRSTAYK